MSFLRTIQNQVLDASIFYSFDRSGFNRHKQFFNSRDTDIDCTGKTYVITGANSGLGKATAMEIAKRKGNVYLLCRNEKKANSAKEEIVDETANPNVHIVLIDLSDLQSVTTACNHLQHLPIDALINNAGVLPDERWASKQGHEGTFATNVLGSHLLTKKLYPALESRSQSKIIWVSSGGMYSTKLHLNQLIDPKEPFDGVKAYAQTKRAQVILNRMWSQYGSVSTYCMHPGWAATPGVQTSLPKFQKMMQGRLRTSQQGADTIVWLAISPSITNCKSGTFWFDRRTVSEHFFPWTSNSADEEQALWNKLESLTEEFSDVSLPK